MTRIALIADDGTTTVGGVVCKIVPVEMMMSTIDLSALPKLPERKAYIGYGYTVDEDAAWIDGYNECIDLIAPTPNAEVKGGADERT